MGHEAAVDDISAPVMKDDRPTPGRARRGDVPGLADAANGMPV